MWSKVSWNETNYTKLINELKFMVDDTYREFHLQIIPGCMNFLGVRMPQLRKLGKEIAKGDGRGFLTVAGHKYYEEIMLQGIVIGAMKSDIDTLLKDTADFVPLISNWALCDCFCGGLKGVKQHYDIVRGFLEPYLRSEQTYEVRFAVVLLMDHFTDAEHLSDLFSVYDEISHTNYYVKMAVAWGVSTAFAKFPSETMTYLKHCKLPDWTYQKALQKILESRRVSQEDKEQIRAMRL